MNRGLASVQGDCLNLGGASDLHPDETKKLPRKRSIHQYVSIYWQFFRFIWAKYGVTLVQRERLLTKTGSLL